MAFSPNFARDRTLFLAANSSGFPGPVDDSASRQTPAANEQSLGVMISTDGGSSWTASSPGPSVDDVPYRHVQLIVPSPTFAEDGTVFAFAWGPRWTDSGGFRRYVRTALFRSRDRGASWDKISVDRTGNFPMLAVSPTFAVDGVAILAARSLGVSPNSYSCGVYRTANGGDSWGVVSYPGSYEGCERPLLVRSGDQLTALFFKNSWRVSKDGGATWNPLTSSQYGQPGKIIPSPAYKRDRTLFGSIWNRGLWALGPDVGTASGEASVPIPPDSISR